MNILMNGFTRSVLSFHELLSLSQHISSQSFRLPVHFQLSDRLNDSLADMNRLTSDGNGNLDFDHANALAICGVGFQFPFLKSLVRQVHPAGTSKIRQVKIPLSELHPHVQTPFTGTNGLTY